MRIIISLQAKLNFNAKDRYDNYSIGIHSRFLFQDRLK